MTLVVSQPVIPEADTYFTGFQLSNPYLNPLLILGNFFVGIQAHGAIKFETALPKRAEILSASLDMTAAVTASGARLVNINSATDGAWKPASFGPAFRGEFWASFKSLIRDTGGGTIQNIVPTNPNPVRNLRLEPLKRIKLAQRVNPATTGTLGDIILRMRRVGAPTGNMSLQVVGSDLNGPVLATSDNVLSTSPPVAPAYGLVTFPFTGLDQITLTVGQVYHIILDATYPINGLAFVQWNQIQQFFGTGGAKHYGTDVAFGNQNYPSHADLSLQLGNLGTNVPWSIPNNVAGVTYTSPSLKTLIQETVNHATYNSGDPIALVLRATGGNTFRRMASFDHATFAPPTLTVDFIPGTFDHIIGTGRVTQRIIGQAPVTQRIIGQAPVTQRIIGQAPVTQRIIGKAPVTQRITK